MSVHVFTRARVSIRLKGQISENNRVAIAFEQGILEITEPDTVFIIIIEPDTVFIIITEPDTVFIKL